jgi:hypothetical protein
MRTTLIGGILLAAVGALAGCDDEVSLPDFRVDVTAKWNVFPSSQAELGYTLTVRLFQWRHSQSGDCRNAPASTTVTANGELVPLSRVAGSTCLEGELVLGPSLEDRTVTARIEEDGHLVGEALFEELTPGTHATLVTPADGMVHAGDDIVILPPPELPTSLLVLTMIHPLEAPVWDVFGPYVQDQVRLPDGIHIKAPAFAGPAVLSIGGIPTAIDGKVSCPDFAACSATADGTLGPFHLTGVP